MKQRMAIRTVSLMMLAALAACSGPWVQKTESAGTELPAAGIPNPASLYCQENGGLHEITTAADGSQSGICTFADGSTCDEWAYFRGECGPAQPTTEASGGGPGGTGETVDNGSGGFIQPGATEEFSDWWGVIKSTTSGAEFDDYFERQDLGQTFINFGIDSLDPAIQAQIVSLRDSGKIVHIYGTLFSNVPDTNGSQVQVNRIEVEE